MPDQSPNQYSRLHRPSKVLDAMHGVASQYYGITIYPLVDALTLLLQKPVIFSFLLVDHTEEIYRRFLTNFQDEELLSEFEREMPSLGQLSDIARSIFRIAIPAPNPSRLKSTEAVILCLHKIVSSESGAISFQPYLTSENVSDIDLLKKFVALLANDGSRSTQRVLSALEEQVYRRYSTTVPASIGAKSSALANVDEAKILGRIRDSIISPCLFEFQNNPLVGGRKDSPLTNAFCVIRRALSPNQAKRLEKFDYTAQLMLAKFQQDEITVGLWRGEAESVGSVGKADIEQVLFAAECPLGSNYRSIADSVFASGMTDFSFEHYGHGRDGCRGEVNPKDESRKAAEQEIFSLLPVHAGNARHIFYIPIHAGGVPWIALFSLTETHDEEIPDPAWEHNFLLYLQAPLFANRLRTAAQSCYREALATELETILRGAVDPDADSAGKALNDINARWSELTAYFPYDLVEIVALEMTQQASSSTIRLPGGTLAEIRTSRNPNACFLRNHIEFDPLDVQAMTVWLAIATDKIGIEKTRILLERESAQRLEQADVAHASKSIMGTITSLIRLARNSATSPDERDRDLWLAEQYSLFVGQDAGALQQMIQGVDTSYLTRMSELELSTAVDLCLKFMAGVSQLIYSATRRFFVNNDALFEADPSELMTELRDHIQNVYARMGIQQPSAEWEFKKDPIFCVLFFMFRELVDNMRHRPGVNASTTVDWYIDTSLFGSSEIVDEPIVVVLTQRVLRKPPFEHHSPFVGADRADSIQRFNARFGRDSRFRMAEVVPDKPSASGSWHVFRQEIRLFRNAVKRAI